MGKLILTGLTKKGRHRLKLEYKEKNSEIICLAICDCGFQEQIVHYRNYAGVKEVESIWKKHVGE